MDITGDLSLDLFVLPCRACTNEQIRSRMYFLYKDPEITEIFVQFSTIQIYEKDGLPTHICQQCNTQLNDFINFRKTCVSSDETFRHKNDVKHEIISKGVKLESVELCEIELPKKTLRVELEPEVKVELEEIQFDDTFNDDDDDGLPNDETMPEVTPKRTTTKKKKAKSSPKKTDKNKKPSESRSNFICDHCDARFNKKHRIEAHLRQHLGLKPFECQECNVGFRKWASFKLHNKVNHSSEQFKRLDCPYDGCSKSYNLNQSLKIHVQTIHLGLPHRKPKTLYICETCGKSFKMQFTLKEHIYTHTGETPYPCPQCPKKFLSKYKLKIHLMRHNNIRNHVCSVCGLGKTTNKELKIHMNLHTEEKSYPCDLCPSVFRNYQNLNRHNRIVHRGYKPYVCTYCQRRFSKAETLKHHTMTHTGEKPHACQICDKRFIQAIALKTHLKVHAKHNKIAIPPA